MNIEHLGRITINAKLDR